MVHIYYGQGVGKTSRSVGLAFRAAGTGLQVDFVQFMKSGKSGEVSVLKTIPNIRYYCPGEHPFIMSQGPSQVHFDHAQNSYQYAEKVIEQGTNVMICDEILNTIIFGIFQPDKILALINKCRENSVELVMTGRHAPDKLLKAADYITEFAQIKHPYYSGSRARKGIEY